MRSPLDPKQTRSVRHWAAYALFYPGISNAEKISSEDKSAMFEAHRHPWGVIESPDGKLEWCYSRNHQEWIHPEQVWDRSHIPPVGIQNAMWHGGTDILPLPKGLPAPVYAVQAGEVVWVWHGKSMGGSIAVAGEFRGAPLVIIYQHLDPATLPKEGKHFAEGDQIGRLADLGDNTHLHCEVWSPEWLWLPDDPIGDPRNWCFKYNEHAPRGQYQPAAYQAMGINPHSWMCYAVMALVAVSNA